MEIKERRGRFKGEAAKLSLFLNSSKCMETIIVDFTFQFRAWIPSTSLIWGELVVVGIRLTDDVCGEFGGKG